MAQRIQFTREQLLQVYRNDLPVPEGMNKNTQYFIEQPLTPRLLQTHQTTTFHSKNPRGGTRKNPKKVVRDIEPTNPNKIVQPKPMPKQPQAVSTPVAWYYIDPTDTIQGPFLSQLLREWWQKQLFPDNIRISVSNDKSTFKEIINFFPDLSLAFTYNPLLFPFLGKAEPDLTDPLQQVFVKYEESLAH
ncbi:GYF domain containing protein [Tritrichomonas foetus]|uniref:GYF domain containing protein n=1 Tax=Tritrichomonas foetus TaxID=1144522 RepID=A0A1J4K533_9EUKA|nr:GYF domain containing protein [Tritrichomonas foetus]|eukprot:OHT04828.1 GYF domain containing protein [Tritrichomonas foetus]